MHHLLAKTSCLSSSDMITLFYMAANQSHFLQLSIHLSQAITNCVAIVRVPLTRR